MKPIISFVIALAIPVAVGSLAGFFTASSVTGWYVTLEKPSFNPPNWVFAPVWTALYIMMGVASWLAWKKSSAIQYKKTALSIYGIQLFFNFCWSLIFFFAKQPGWALLDIILLWLLILLNIYWFAKLSRAAAWLLVPYLFWVSFATVLNYAIWKLN